MKVLLSLTLVAMMGCLKPLPPEPPRPIVVEIRRLPPTVVKGEMIEVLPEPEPPVHTWLTGEELQKVLEERAKKQSDCWCSEGDPLCGCLP